MQMAVRFWRELSEHAALCFQPARDRVGLICERAKIMLHAVLFQGRSPFTLTLDIEHTRHPGFVCRVQARPVPQVLRSSTLPKIFRAVVIPNAVDVVNIALGPSAMCQGEHDSVRHDIFSLQLNHSIPKPPVPSDAPHAPPLPPNQNAVFLQMKRSAELTNARQLSHPLASFGSTLMK
jgi:hypothetical protein